MNTIEIPAINYTKQLPASWDELTHEQYLFIVDLYLKLKNREITIPQFKKGALCKFLQISFAGYSRLKEDVQIEIASKIDQLSELFHFFFVEEADNITFNYDFTQNLIPKVKCGWFTRLYGPDQALTNITFAEYIDAHSFYKQYAETANEDYLNMLVAVLYRKKQPFLSVKRNLFTFNGQIRVKYNQNRLDYYVKHVKKLPFVVKYAVFLWFNGCENHLRHGDISINGYSINLSLLYKQSQTAETESHQTADIGIISLLYTVAESGVFGNIEKTAQTNLYDIFVYLYKKVIEQRKLEEKYKK